MGKFFGWLFFVIAVLFVAAMVYNGADFTPDALGAF